MAENDIFCPNGHKIGQWTSLGGSPALLIRHRKRDIWILCETNKNSAKIMIKCERCGEVTEIQMCNYELSMNSL